MCSGLESENRFYQSIELALNRADPLAIEPPSGRTIWVCYSGGVDSHLLLYYLIQFVKHGAGRSVFGESPRLRAIHVNHQVSPNASLWAQHCLRISIALGIELEIVNINIAVEASGGFEAAAREARYEAFREKSQAGDLFFLGQHADDQLETLLYRFVRGTGPEGLVGMSIFRTINKRFYFRPFIHFSSAEITAEAVRLGLQWVDDESNCDSRFDRNYLRHQVVPKLKERWPQVLDSVHRLSDHCQAASEILNERAEEDLEACTDYFQDCAKNEWLTASLGLSIDCNAIKSLSLSRQHNLFRYWLRKTVGKSPSFSVLVSLQHQLIAARSDRNPWIQWENHWITRYNQRLYILNCQPDGKVGRKNDLLPVEQIEAPIGSDFAVQWHPIEQPCIEWQGFLLIAKLTDIRDTSSLPAPEGLSLERVEFPLTIKVRQGGESIKPVGDKHTRSVKKLMQQQKIPFWLRNRLPFFYAHIKPTLNSLTHKNRVQDGLNRESEGGSNSIANSVESRKTLVAVSDQWISDSCVAVADEQCLEISIQAVSENADRADSW